MSTPYYGMITTTDETALAVFPFESHSLTQMFRRSLMRRIHVSILLVWACSLQVAWCQQPTSWAQFHRYNMQRYNPYEKVIGVNNVANLKLKWSFTLDDWATGSPIVAGGVVYTPWMPVRVPCCGVTLPAAK